MVQNIKLESTFTSELPGDPETKNQRRQVRAPCQLRNLEAYISRGYIPEQRTQLYV